MSCGGVVGAAAKRRNSQVVNQLAFTLKGKGLAMQSAMKYVELKSGYSDNGPAWITRVAFSKSGQTVYFNGHALFRCNCGSGNHIDTETGEEYWVSGVKKVGTNRHPCGKGKIAVQRDVLEEFLAWTCKKTLDITLYELDLSSPANAVC